MSQKRSFNNELKINEAAHTEAPSFFRRMLNTVIAVVLGILFAQAALLLLARFTPLGWSIVFYRDSPILIGFLVVCGILGFVVGDRFLETLKVQAIEWLDVWYGLLPSWWKFK